MSKLNIALMIANCISIAINNDTFSIILKDGILSCRYGKLLEIKLNTNQLCTITSKHLCQLFYGEILYED